MTDSASTSCSYSRWLHRGAIVTLALLFALLTLGAIVTSFRVGMADPVWPTRPWHLALTNWHEESRGFLIEHTHRLAGFVVGGVVSILALALWLTEPRPKLRWGGFLALAALLLAFGQLHGTLITHQKVFQRTGELTTPEWTTALVPTLVALALVALLTAWASFPGTCGSGVRLLGVVLLVGVMTQGILGGLRVYLNALVGPELAAVHGVFSQVVLTVAVILVVYSAPRRDVPADDRWHADAALVCWGVLSAVVVFGQIVAGAVLRHSASPLGPRLHLLAAFLVVFATAAVSRRLPADAPRGIRVLAKLAAALAGVQILLGIEAWMIRFRAGILAAPFQAITVPDAIVRTAHVVVGYALFATMIGLAVTLFRARESLPQRNASRRSVAELEGVA